MYISNPNRKRRADIQANSNPDRSQGASDNRAQVRSQPPRQQSQNFQFNAPQPQANTPAPRTQPPLSPQLNDTGLGGIVVRVTTASGAIPLENALVTVREYGTGSGGEIIATLKTNSSGLTEKISLPAPPRSMSLSPGNGKSYSSYIIQVDKEGYSTQQYINVPVFDGITAVQSADLVPLPENGQTDRANPYNPGIFYESEAPRLDSSNQSN